MEPLWKKSEHLTLFFNFFLKKVIFDRSNITRIQNACVSLQKIAMSNAAKLS